MILKPISYKRKNNYLNNKVVFSVDETVKSGASGKPVSSMLHENYSNRKKRGGGCKLNPQNVLFFNLCMYTHDHT